MAKTTRVQMMTTASGPDWHCQAGQEVDLPAETVEALIAGGYARLVGAESEYVQAPLEAETAEDGVATWTADGAEDAEEDDMPEMTPGSPVEQATAGPQRQTGADDQVAAERAGREAAEAGRPRSDNPYDRRTTLGRAWDRGHQAVASE